MRARRISATIAVASIMVAACGSDADDAPVAAPAVPAAETSEPAASQSRAANEPTTGWPDDGCSADNSPTPAAAADGPLPLIEVRAESVDSPLPDLAVRRINCKGGWVNLRNELPSDQPLLVWFWAPY